MASNLNSSNPTNANSSPEPHNYESSDSASSISVGSVASDVSFLVVSHTHPAPNHQRWGRGALKQFIIDFVIEGKLEPFDTPWLGLYDAHPELVDLPRFNLPALQTNHRAIRAQHMTIQPSAALLAKFHPVPTWEGEPPLCGYMSRPVAQAYSAALYEGYLEACAYWEDTALLALREQTVDGIITAFREIPNDTSILSHYHLVPRSVRFRSPGTKVTTVVGEEPAHESQHYVVRVEKWLHGVFGWHGML
jgi:hypothetical protein